MSWLREHLKRAGLQKGEILRLELVLEEAFVNSVQHGYKEKQGVIELEFQMTPKSHVAFSIADQGPPFNPLKEAPKPNLGASLEEREVGGLGIYLMQHCVDDVKYAREGDWNKLWFVKRFSQTT